MAKLRSRRRNVTLDEQLELLELRGHSSLVTLGLELVCNASFRDEVLRGSKRRMKNGYPIHRDRMFRWTKARRRKEKLEELSDYVNYDISGPVELHQVNR